MKKCNYCGAPIKGNAAAFCLKCKKPLKNKPKKRRPVPVKPKQSLQSNKKPAARKSKPPTLKPNPRKKNPNKNVIFRLRLWLAGILNPEKKINPDAEPVSVINPMDENYDGYYDDKPTDDNEQNRETLEPELIKRIIFISGGAAVIIILAVVLLNLL